MYDTCRISDGWIFTKSSLKSNWIPPSESHEMDISRVIPVVLGRHFCWRWPLKAFTVWQCEPWRYTLRVRDSNIGHWDEKQKSYSCGYSAISNLWLATSDTCYISLVIRRIPQLGRIAKKYSGVGFWRYPLILCVFLWLLKQERIHFGRVWTRKTIPIYARGDNFRFKYKTLLKIPYSGAPPDNCLHYYDNCILVQPVKCSQLTYTLNT